MNVFDWISMVFGCIWGVYGGIKEWRIWDWRFFTPVVLFVTIITFIEFTFF